jgi:alpha-amylase/alpha-mannosidase (GH57 family)
MSINKKKIKKPEIIKRLEWAIKKYPNEKYFVIPQKTLENIYKKDGTIVSLVRNSLYHYEMLIALQQQIVCLEAKIKILEARLK